MNTLDWKMIKEQYPNANHRFNEWLTFNFQADDVFNQRDLYDFFDGEGIIMDVIYYPTDKVFVSTFTYGKTSPEPREGFKTRTETEAWAFTEAFKILEKQLQGKVVSE